MNYQTHLDSIRDRISSQVRDLAQICLHDAELLACDQKIQPSMPLPFDASFWSALGILSFKQNDIVFSLIYGLWDRIRKYPPPGDWPFSNEQTHWLYDEIDVAPTASNRFVHRILLSDGQVLEVPFVTVVTQSIPLSETRKDNVLEHIAG